MKQYEIHETLFGFVPKTNLQKDVAEKPRQNERLRCQHLLAAPDTHHALHLLGAIDAIEDSGGIGVSGGHVFSG